MCSADQESLVYIDIDTLTVNDTALQQLGLLESQVRYPSKSKRRGCSYPSQHKNWVFLVVRPYVAGGCQICKIFWRAAHVNYPFI